MKKKILGVLLVVGIIAGVIAGCGNSNTTQNGAENASQASATAKARTIDEIKKSGKIKIGVFSDKNPFGYVDENGKVQGMMFILQRELQRIFLVVKMQLILFM